MGWFHASGSIAGHQGALRFQDQRQLTVEIAGWGVLCFIFFPAPGSFPPPWMEKYNPPFRIARGNHNGSLRRSVERVPGYRGFHRGWNCTVVFQDTFAETAPLPLANI